ncbi:hypothetical protein M2S00_06355 [Apilactobacillus sp. TMW 2.2459]|uniref:hypothetical protein n=1 Tax=Apilactobacillus xinyiensis TaxID=2841032 RepID=UPI001C7CBABF|nr:hypothetical protein [Apilactobacillus xinyiensis]MCL0312724.1 hypothetical protein [Apilactobacillus xinyiensis]
MKNSIKVGIATALTTVLFGVTGGHVAHADSIFIHDSLQNPKVEQVYRGNVLTGYDDPDRLTKMTNPMPNLQHQKKFTRVKVNMLGNTPLHNYPTADDSGEKNAFNTTLYLPTGFNVSPKEHGNYQSVVVANDSIYLVESMGTGTNEGDIIRFKLSDLEDLGLFKEGGASLLLQAYDFTNPYNNSSNNMQMLMALGDVKKAMDSQNGLQTTINNIQTQISAQNTSVNNLNALIKKTNKNKKLKAKDKKKTVNGYKTQIKNTKKLISSLNQQLATPKQQYQDNEDTIDAAKQKYPFLNNLSAIQKAVQISPLINVGHGQTLSWNPKTQHLYLAQDESLNDLTPGQNNNVTELDPNTLEPIRQYHFRLQQGGTSMQLHTLTFDNDGNAYIGRKRGANYVIFKGRLDTNNINFKPVGQMLNWWKGAANQCLSYNAANNRLYVVSNDAIVSVPVDKLGSGVLVNDDVHYTTFNTGREFEGLGFDSSGRGYMLMLWKPELLQTQDPMN